jgi:hypothetical protein
MKFKAWCAALLAALVLTFGLFAQPRECVAGFNDDVELEQPPTGERGDPDSGGGGGYFIQRLGSWVTIRICRALSGWSVAPRGSTLESTTAPARPLSRGSRR